MSNFTPEDLLEYFYEGISYRKTEAIQNALENQWPLQQKYNVIVQAAEKLEKSLLSPRCQSVQAVLNHATKHQASADVDH